MSPLPQASRQEIWNAIDISADIGGLAFAMPEQINPLTLAE